MAFMRCWLAPAVAFIAACLDRGYQTDFWHHLARGREIVASARILDTDVFTFTVSGQPLRDVNWLTQVVYFHLYSWGGLPLVQFINAAVAALALAVLVRLCRKVSGSSGAAAAAGGFAFLGLWQIFLLIRPQTLSLLLFSLMYFTLSEARTRRAFLLVPPVLMAAWANVHGGFAIGLVLIGAFAFASLAEQIVARRVKPSLDTVCLMGCLGAGALATLLNPYGWHVYEYVGAVASRAAGRHVEEWLPPGLGSWVGIVFYGSLVLVAGLHVWARRRPSILDLCLMICFLPLACRSVRMVAWWVIVVSPMIAVLVVAVRMRWMVRSVERENGGNGGLRPPAKRGAWDATSDGDERRAGRPSVPALVLTLTLSALAIVSLPWMERWNPLFGALRDSHRTESNLQAVSAQLASSDFPRDSRVFTRLEWGEYLDWSLGPTGRVFMDGRIEIYPDGLWKQYCTVTSGADGWQDILDRYGVDCLLLDRDYHARLLPAVRASEHWREAAGSGPAVLFVRAAGNGVPGDDRKLSIAQ